MVSSAYSLCKQWTASVSNTVFSCPAFCAMTRPVCHCWCDSSHLVVVVLVLHAALMCAAASSSTSRSSLAPHVLRRSTSVLAGRPLLPSVRFACTRYSVLLLQQPTPALALPPGSEGRRRTTTTRSTHHHAALGLSLICTPMLPPVHLAVRLRRRRYAFTCSAQHFSGNTRVDIFSRQHLDIHSS